MDFNIDNEIKSAFLNKKPTNTSYSVSFVLKLIDDYELLAKKKLYNLSFAELGEMISMQFKNSSWGAIVKNVSIGNRYYDYCISQNLVSHGTNRLSLYTKKRLKQFVSKQALEFKYTTPEQLKIYQNQLDNNQDKLIIACPYYGIKGKRNEEIINLKFNPKSKEKVLNLVKTNGNSRELFVNNELMKLVEDTYNDEYYISNNGVDYNSLIEGAKKSVINNVDEYVFRIPGSNKLEQFNSGLINLRMTKIQQWLGNEYLTVNSLYTSGMIAKAKEIITEKKSIDIDDYIAICFEFNYVSKDPRVSAFRLKEIVEQYIEGVV